MSSVLKDYAEFVTEHIDSNNLTSKNYIGMDNMIPDKGGVRESEYTPTSGKVIAFKKGDILIGNIRPYFKKIWYATFDGGCSPDVLCIRSKGKLSSKYIYGALSQDLFFDYDMAGAKGSKMPRGDKNHIMNFPIVYSNNQKKIGDFIVSLFKKTEKNNKIILELESMAKTIYDYWFLQYEFPNEEGKPYKSSGGKMVYNEELKKEIPEGWTGGKFKDITDMYQPRTIAMNNLKQDGKYNVYGANGIIGKYDQYNHEQNEIAVCCRGAACGEYLMTLPFSWVTGNAMIIKPKDDNYKEYIFYKLSDKDIFNYITGSAQPQITRNNLENMKIIIPNSLIIEKFNKIAINVRKQIIKSMLENQELTRLRDELLPLLMNGQVGFKE